MARTVELPLPENATKLLDITDDVGVTNRLPFPLPPPDPAVAVPEIVLTANCDMEGAHDGAATPVAFNSRLIVCEPDARALLIKPNDPSICDESVTPELLKPLPITS